MANDSRGPRQIRELERQLAALPPAAADVAPDAAVSADPAA
jgi:hypothetical protein